MDYQLEIEKSQQACEILSELDIACWLVWVRETSQTPDPVLELILGGDVVWRSAFLFTRDGEKIGIVGNFDADAIEAKGIYDRVVPYTEGIRDQLVSELDKFRPRQVAINFSKDNVAADGLTVGMLMKLKEYLKDTPYLNRLVSAEEIVTRLRGRKIENESARIIGAINITEAIYKKMESFVRVGMTEIEVYRYFHELMKEYDVTSAWNEDHNPAVDAGPDKQFGHSGPTENRIKKRHLLHFDFGVRWQGYCSDIQRMFFFGSRSAIPEEVQTAFETVRDAIQEASRYISPGVLGYEVDALARKFVKDRGYEEYQHALGHQVGLRAHDGGTLLGPLWERYGNSPKGVVEAGNVFTLELYVTTSDYGQVSLEENILVTRSGCQFLSNPQSELICIE
ncbi:MAG: aminopeptidase P family protein [Candidatus Thorarchaeota archaeon]|nr:aminopeptidase P family protein [Candidatus Thorarchaeota archaeon]